MKKDFFWLIFFGLLGGIAGGYFFSFVVFTPANISELTIPSPIVVKNSNNKLENIISESSLASVGIQVFESNKLIRQGSGVIISSDGFIVTVADLAIANAVYQIYYEDKIIKARIVAVDYDLNLALLEIDNHLSNIIGLSDSEYKSGQEVTIVGKFFDLSGLTVYSQRGIISYITQKSKVVIDTLASKNLSGAMIMGDDGKFFGLAYLRNENIIMVRAASLDEFFTNYISNKN